MDLTNCAEFIAKFIKNNMNFYFWMSFGISVTFILSMLKALNKLTTFLNIVMFCWFVFIFDNDITAVHFGGAVTKLIGSTTLILTVLGLIAVTAFKSRGRFQIIFLTVLGLTIAVTALRLKNSCDDWDSGFNESFDHSGEYC